jgi:hypothetical protein
MEIILKTLNPLALVMALFLAGQTAQAQSWKQTSAPTGNWWSLASSADGTQLIAAADGIYFSTNSGLTWAVTTNLSQTGWLGVASSGDGARLAAFGNGIYTSSDSGATWNPATNVPSAGWHGLATSADGMTLIAVSDISGSSVYISGDGGARWTPTIVAANLGWQAVSCSADGRVIAMVASFGGRGIYTSTDSGTTWTGSTAISSSYAAAGVAVSADGTTIIAGNGRNLYTSTNSGVGFFTNNVPQGVTWDAVAASADGTKLLAASQSGLVFISTNSGTSWQSNSVAKKSWTSACSSSDGSKLALGITGANGGGIYTWRYAPALSLTTSDTNIVISWPDSTYTNIFGLQQNTDPNTTNWNDAGLPVTDDGINQTVTLPFSGSNLFFRLKQ